MLCNRSGLALISFVCAVCLALGCVVLFALPVLAKVILTLVWFVLSLLLYLRWRKNCGTVTTLGSKLLYIRPSAPALMILKLNWHCEWVMLCEGTVAGRRYRFSFWVDQTDNASFRSLRRMLLGLNKGEKHGTLKYI